MPDSAFDVAAARNAGYTDDEILAHLTQSRNFDIAGALKSGYSKQDVINHLSNSPAPTRSVPGMEKLGGTPPAYPKPPAPKEPTELQEPETHNLFARIADLGLRKVAQGVEQTAQPELSEKAGGASKIIRGALQTAAPVALPAGAIAAPAATALGLAAGSVAGAATEGVAKATGVNPNYAELAGDVAGIVGGGLAAAKGPKAIGAAKNAVVDSLERVNPNQAMTKAARPNNRRLQFDKALDLALPELKASEQELGRPISNISDALDGIALAKKRVYKQYEDIGGRDMSINAYELAKRLRQTSPDQARAIAELGKKYGVNGYLIPMKQAEANLAKINAQLDSYYAKNPAARSVDASKNPDTANLVQEANAWRDAIYNSLDEQGGGAPRELKRRYGALTELQRSLEVQKNVADRQAPMNLYENLGAMRAIGKGLKGGYKMLRLDPSGVADVMDAAGGYAGAKYLRQLNKQDSLVRRAMKYENRIPSAVQGGGIDSQSTYGHLGPPNIPDMSGPLINGPDTYKPRSFDTKGQAFPASQFDSQWNPEGTLVGFPESMTAPETPDLSSVTKLLNPRAKKRLSSYPQK